MLQPVSDFLWAIKMVNSYFTQSACEGFSFKVSYRLLPFAVYLWELVGLKMDLITQIESADSLIGKRAPDFVARSTKGEILMSAFECRDLWLIKFISYYTQKA